LKYISAQFVTVTVTNSIWHETVCSIFYTEVHMQKNIISQIFTENISIEVVEEFYMKACVCAWVLGACSFLCHGTLTSKGTFSVFDFRSFGLRLNITNEHS